MKRSRDIEHSLPSNRRGFGTDITNHGGPGRAKTPRTRSADGDAPRSPMRKSVRQECFPVHPKEGKRRAKGSCGQDECGVVFGAEGELCTMCNPATVHKKGQRLCAACHRPSSDWTHFHPTYLPRATQYLENAKERGVILSDEVLEGYRPSTDCLCTRDDCVAKVARKEQLRSESRRTRCSVCNGNCYAGQRKFPSEFFAAANSFFTTGRGASRRKNDIGCTGALFTERSSLCTTCRKSFYRHQKCAWDTSGTERMTLEDDSHRSEVATDRAKVKIQQSVGDGRVVTLDDAVAFVAGERMVQNLQGRDTYQKRLARDLLRDVHTQAGNTKTISWRDGEGGSDRERSLSLAVVPPQVSQDYAVQVLEELYRTRAELRAELRAEKEKVERLERAASRPFAGLDESAIAQCAQGEEQRLLLVRAAAIIVRDDAREWNGMHKVHRSKERDEELREDLERDMQPLADYIMNMPSTFRAFTETCFGWNMGLTTPVPELFSKEEYEYSLPNSSPDTEERRLRKEVRCVYMLSTMFLKAVIIGKCRAPHDLKLSQVFKSQGTTQMVIDFLANLGVCMTDSERYNREILHVRSREDEGLLPTGIFPIAVAWDNNDVKPTMDVTPGAPYVPFIGATAVGILPDQAPLPTLASREDFREKVTVDEVVNGQPRDEDASTFEGFKKTLLEASWSAWVGFSGQTQTSTCLEAEIRKVS